MKLGAGQRIWPNGRFAMVTHCFCQSKNSLIYTHCPLEFHGIASYIIVDQGKEL